MTKMLAVILTPSNGTKDRLYSYSELCSALPLSTENGSQAGLCSI